MTAAGAGLLEMGYPLIDIAQDIQHALELAVQVDGFIPCQALVADHTGLEAVKEVILFEFFDEDADGFLDTRIVDETSTTTGVEQG